MKSTRLLATTASTNARIRATNPWRSDASHPVGMTLSAGERRGASRRCCGDASQPAGMTLLEVLLALGILAILTALAWPSVMRLQGEQKILDSAEKVRALIATARVHAIESGLAYQFRYETGGNHFLVLPSSIS